MVGILSWLGVGKSADDPAREVLVLNESGFADFDLPLAGAMQVDDGGWIIKALGSLNGSEIGFEVRLGGEWRRQEIDDSALVVFWGTGAIIRSGTESDNFCGLLQDSYGLVGSGRTMPGIIETTVASLGTDPERITEEPLKMKMFIEPDGEDDSYAEFFLNVDLRDQTVQLHEKDNEYRGNIVKAFCVADN